MEDRRLEFNALAWLADALPEFVRQTSEGRRIDWESVPQEINTGLARGAWEALLERGVVPASPAREPSGRSFVRRKKRGCRPCAVRDNEEPQSYEPCRTCFGRGITFVDTRSEQPPTLRAVITIVADVGATLRAEALAREAAVRLWPWRGRRGETPSVGEPPHEVAWRVDEGGTALELARDTRALCPLLFEALYRPSLRLGRRELSAMLERMSEPHYPWNWDCHWRGIAWPPSPDADRAACACYDELALLGEWATFGVRSPLPSTAPNGPFAARPNPFDPVCALWDLGVALERIDPDGIVVTRLAVESGRRITAVIDPSEA